MKTCGKCNKEKCLAEFYRNSSRRDGLSSSCKVCHKQYLKRHYKKNKSYYKNKAKNHLEKLKEIVRSLKEQTPCVDCGVKYPYYVMDFDHIKGKKFADISVVVHTGAALDKLLKEIEKCEIVCSNCHRIRTHIRAVGEMDDHATLRK